MTELPRRKHVRHSRRRYRTWADAYTPDYLAALDAIECSHDEPRGARYCPLCRRAYQQLRGGRR